MTTDTLEALREARRLLDRIDRVYGDMQDGNGNKPTELRKIAPTLFRIDAALAEGGEGLRRCNVCKGLVPTLDAPTTLCGCEYMAPAGTHAALAEGGWRPIETEISDLERRAFNAANAEWSVPEYQALVRDLWKAVCNGSEVASPIGEKQEQC